MRNVIIIGCGAIIFCYLGWRVMATMEGDNDLDPALPHVFGALSREVPCAKGLFAYSRKGDEYDLEEIVQDIAVLGSHEHDEASVTVTARFVAGILGVPLRQKASEINDIRQMAFLRSDDPSVSRKLWTQLLAVYPVNELYSEAADRSRVYIQPERVTIWRGGVLYSWRPWMQGRWDEIKAESGNSLIPQFELFGANKRHIRPEYLDSNQWIMSSSIVTNEGVIKYTWISKDLPINRERGVEISIEKPHVIRRAWSGILNNPPTREYIYKDFVQLSEDIAYPRRSHFRTIIPLEDDTIVVSDEVYRVMDTNIVVTCDYDHSIFEPDNDIQEINIDPLMVMGTSESLGPSGAMP